MVAKNDTKSMAAAEQLSAALIALQLPIASVLVPS